MKFLFHKLYALCTVPNIQCNMFGCCYMMEMWQIVSVISVDTCSGIMHNDTLFLLHSDMQVSLRYILYLSS